MRSQWPGIATGMLLGVTCTALKVTIPRIVSDGIDRGIVRDRPGVLLHVSLLTLGIGTVQGVLAGFRRWNAMAQGRRAEATLRDRVFAHLQGLHFGFHDRAHAGDLMSRANTDLNSIQQFVSLMPLTTVSISMVVGATGVLLWTDPVLAALALLCLPLLNVLGRRFAVHLFPEVLAIQQESAQLATVVEEAVSGVRVIKGFGAEDVLAARLLVEVDDVFEASMAAARVRARYLPVLELLPTVSMVVVLLVGGHRVIDGRLSLGDLVAFNVYLVLMIAPLKMLGTIVTTYQRAVAAGGRVHEILAVEPAIVDLPHARVLPEGNGAIRFEAVRFAYDAGRPLFDSFDLEVEAGTSIALVGATGSGKTTLARLLPRFYDVLGGRILFDGVDVRELRLHELRSAVATVFEETFLFSDTLAANIAFAQPDAPPEVIERAARLAGAHEFVTELPDGYRTIVGERGFSLSGGQRQRIAIARAVLTDPRVLILDDATSAVDPTKEHEIRDSLAEVMRGRTTIVIAHRPATIALADRVVLLDGGRVAAEGTHDDLLATCERYRQVLAAAAVAASATVPVAATEEVGP
ncbi:MAG: ABC-type multidrug transport system, ATPase and permease component [Acidimicrobiales bacterium]|nr:ABC-type multidrug transport system, ATPase and permease component [Acidimicrobiales bacterium]